MPSEIDFDTIVAIATPPGRGGIGVVRVSGPLSGRIAAALTGTPPRPRQALHRAFRDASGQSIDDGIALFFAAPRSFTGEDVLELQGHGGPVVQDMLVEACIELGARPARPGEFSERAFLNGKLDLAQAEAVADLIDSGSRAAARAALHSLEGALSSRVQALNEQLIELRTYVEAAIDFADEEADFLSEPQLQARLDQARRDLTKLERGARHGRVLRDGIHLVIAGQPNAGKSSLLNALAGRESAIVTEVPGTTRDLLREYVQIDGIPLHITDTAGLRETEDRVERIGVDRAWQALADADRILLVVDQRQGFSSEDRDLLQRLPEGVGVTLVHNKIDLTGDRAPPHTDAEDVMHVFLSAKTGEGLEHLRRHLKDVAGDPGGEGEFTARRRHLDALRRTRDHLECARAHLLQASAGELAAEELRLAHAALSEITGAFSSEDLLGRIFSQFCIGK